ncbi:hypothetical protein G4B88_007127 [Cannabis sativa]|uniref:Reverse transcriptase zinc-binding domain-containing protein n=1 Tax=Cannabis sativa TaxID=3483 RepID=A0A7J6GQ46_CANSA|nr:hypothetical protein G4B88_007127 [Cannabis sativa]
MAWPESEHKVTWPTPVTNIAWPESEPRVTRPTPVTKMAWPESVPKVARPTPVTKMAWPERDPRVAWPTPIRKGLAIEWSLESLSQHHLRKLLGQKDILKVVQPRPSKIVASHIGAKKLVNLRDKIDKQVVYDAGISGKFRIGKFYNSLISAPQVLYHKDVWHKLKMPKHRFILWQAINGNLQTRDRLAKRVIVEITSLLSNITSAVVAGVVYHVWCNRNRPAHIYDQQNNQGTNKRPAKDNNSLDTPKNKRAARI